MKEKYENVKKKGVVVDQIFFKLMDDMATNINVETELDEKNKNHILKVIATEENLGAVGNTSLSYNGRVLLKSNPYRPFDFCVGTINATFDLGIDYKTNSQRKELTFKLQSGLGLQNDNDVDQEMFFRRYWKIEISSNNPSNTVLTQMEPTVAPPCAKTVIERKFTACKLSQTPELSLSKEIETPVSYDSVSVTSKGSESQSKASWVFALKTIGNHNTPYSHEALFKWRFSHYKFQKTVRNLPEYVTSNAPFDGKATWISAKSFNDTVRFQVTLRQTICALNLKEINTNKFKIGEKEVKICWNFDIPFDHVKFDERFDEEKDYETYTASFA